LFHQATISELEKSLEATENEREECLLKAATTRSVCVLLTNKLREITDEMDEQRGSGAQDPDGLQHRMLVLEKELAAICSEKDEVAARLEVLTPAASQPVRKGSAASDAAAAAELKEAQVCGLPCHRAIMDTLCALSCSLFLTPALLLSRCGWIIT